MFWSSLVCRIQFCMIASLGQLRESAPSPPFSSTSLVLLPATFSQLLRLHLVQVPLAGPRVSEPDILQLRLLDVVGDQILQATSLPPLSSSFPFCPLRRQPPWLCRWQGPLFKRGLPYPDGNSINQKFELLNSNISLSCIPMERLGLGLKRKSHWTKEEIKGVWQMNVQWEEMEKEGDRMADRAEEAGKGGWWPRSRLAPANRV